MTTLLLGLGLLLGACGGTVETPEGQSEDQGEQLQIVDVRVERRRGIGSPNIETALRQKLRSALPVQDEELRTANLIVVIEDYSAPGGTGGGNAASDADGASGSIGGRVYLVDWNTGAPLADFRSNAQGGDVPSLLDSFAATIIDRVF